MSTLSDRPDLDAELRRRVRAVVFPGPEPKCQFRPEFRHPRAMFWSAFLGSVAGWLVIFGIVYLLLVFGGLLEY